MSINRINQELMRLYGNRAGQAREGGKADGAGPTSEATTDASRPGAARGDSVALSGRVRELRRVVDIVRNLPDIREERVAELRQQIQDGSYQVPEEGLASRLMRLGPR